MGEGLETKPLRFGCLFFFPFAIAPFEVFGGSELLVELTGSAVVGFGGVGVAAFAPDSVT